MIKAKLVTTSIDASQQKLGGYDVSHRVSVTAMMQGVVRVIATLPHGECCSHLLLWADIRHRVQPIGAVGMNFLGGNTNVRVLARRLLLVAYCSQPTGKE